MRFLADESCDFTIVRVLRDAGYDVVAVAEVAPGAEDVTVIDLAVHESRMLLTEDKDFGRFVYADKLATAGILLLRYPVTARGIIARTVVDLVRQHGDRLAGRFVIAQPGRVRISGGSQS